MPYSGKRKSRSVYGRPAKSRRGRGGAGRRPGAAGRRGLVKKRKNARSSRKPETKKKEANVPLDADGIPNYSLWNFGASPTWVPDLTSINKYTVCGPTNRATAIEPHTHVPFVWHNMERNVQPTGYIGQDIFVKWLTCKFRFNFKEMTSVGIQVKMRVIHGYCRLSGQDLDPSIPNGVYPTEAGEFATIASNTGHLQELIKPIVHEELGKFLEGPDRSILRVLGTQTIKPTKGMPSTVPANDPNVKTTGLFQTCAFPRAAVTITCKWAPMKKVRYSESVGAQAGNALILNQFCPSISEDPAGLWVPFVTIIDDTALGVVTNPDPQYTAGAAAGFTSPTDMRPFTYNNPKARPGIVCRETMYYTDS